MRTMTVAVLVAGMAAAVAARQGAGPKSASGLEMTVMKVEHAATASLRDCPPGSNTINATSRAGETFALVSVAFKVLPNFKPSPMKRPTVTDTAGKTFNTASTFVDVGSMPEYSCTFPFRVPDGAKLKSLQIETATFDLTKLDAGKP